MQELEGSVKPIEVCFEILPLQWLRLQFLCEREKIDLVAGVNVALRVGLDAVLVPETVGALLDSSGHLQMVERGDKRDG